MDAQAKLSLSRETVGEGKSLYQALGDSYTRLSKLDFETTDYFMLDNNWRFVYFNGTALDIMKQTKSTILHKDIWEIYPKDIEEGLYTKLTQARLDMLEIKFEEHIKTLDKWLSFFVYPCGEGLIVYIKDISERVKRDQRVELTQKIINSSPFVMFYIQATDNWPVELVTDNVLSLTGYAADEFYDGITFSDIIYHEDINKVRENYANLLSKKNDPFTLAYRIITKDGTIKWVEEKALPEKNEFGDIVAYQSLIYAVTDKKNPKSKQISIVYYDSFERDTKVIDQKEQKDLKQALAKAIKRKELALTYQPNVSSVAKRMNSVEAKLSWNSPKQEVIQQEELLHLAESIGKREEIEKWVINSTCQQLNQWKRMGLPQLNLELSLTTAQFFGESFIDYLKEALVEYNIESSAVQLNISKEALVMNRGFSIRKINALKESGFKVAVAFPIEDVTLRDVADYNIDIIKIDKKFIEKIADANNKKVISSVIKQGHKLGLQIEATGVETKEQVEILKGLNCDYQQGNYFSEPVAAEHITMYFDSYMSALYKQSQ